MSSILSRAPVIALPQEIIDLIIDNVAQCANPLEGRTVDALRACSFVSSSFHRRSRTHLFSSLDILIDKHGEKRTARLRAILELEANQELVQSVRSIKLTLDMSSSVAPNVLSLKRTSGIFKRPKNLRPEKSNENNLTRVLEILACTPITSFEMDASGGHFDWTKVGSRARAALISICSGPALQTLRFSHIRNLRGAFIVGENYSTSLCELVLRSVWLHPPPETSMPSDPILTMATDHVLKIEQMELTNVSYTRLPQVLRPHIGSSLSACFPHLRTLKVSLPLIVSEMQSLQKIVEESTYSLEHLVLNDIEPHQGLLETIRLDQMPSLKTLNLSTRVSGSESTNDFNTKRTTMASLLGLPSSSSSSTPKPITVQSITIDFHLPLLCNDVHEQGWTELDDALTFPHFADLRKVIVNLIVAHGGSEGYSNSGSYSGDLQRTLNGISVSERKVMPQVCASPWIEFRVNLSVQASYASARG